MRMSELLTLCFAAVFAENLVLTKIFAVDALGKKAGGIYKTCLGMIPVMTLAVPAGRLLKDNLLAPMGLEHMSLVLFAAVAALLAWVTESVYNGITKNGLSFMPLVTFNCALIGVMLDGAYGEYNLLGCAVLGLASALGFVFAVAVFHGVKQRLALASPNKSFEGAPLTLLAIGLVIMAFTGFSELDFGTGLMVPFKLH